MVVCYVASSNHCEQEQNTACLYNKPMDVFDACCAERSMTESVDTPSDGNAVAADAQPAASSHAYSDASSVAAGASSTTGLTQPVSDNASYLHYR